MVQAGELQFSRLENNEALKRIKVLCEQTRELTHDFLDYV